MWDFVLVSVLNPTMPIRRLDDTFKGVGKLRTSSPKRYLKENTYFACLLYGKKCSSCQETGSNTVECSCS
jgi:hypothetical protein